MFVNSMITYVLILTPQKFEINKRNTIDCECNLVTWCHPDRDNI